MTSSLTSVSKRSTSSSVPGVSVSSYDQLEQRLPEVLQILKKDKALSAMILDMINKLSKSD